MSSWRPARAEGVERRWKQKWKAFQRLLSPYMCWTQRSINLFLRSPSPSSSSFWFPLSLFSLSLYLSIFTKCFKSERGGKWKSIASWGDLRKPLLAKVTRSIFEKVTGHTSSLLTAPFALVSLDYLVFFSSTWNVAYSSKLSICFTSKWSRPWPPSSLLHPFPTVRFILFPTEFS